MPQSQTWQFSTKRHTSSNLVIQHRYFLKFDVYTESSYYLRDSHVLWLLQLPYSSTALKVSAIVAIITLQTFMGHIAKVIITSFDDREYDGTIEKTVGQLHRSQ
jgi:hypothetical protein